MRKPRNPALSRPAGLELARVKFERNSLERLVIAAQKITAPAAQRNAATWKRRIADLNRAIET